MWHHRGRLELLLVRLCYLKRGDLIVLNFGRRDTGIEILAFAKNSLNPDINISLVRIMIAAITS